MIEEVNRFLDHDIEKGDLTSLRRCMDLLMIKSLADRVADKFIKFWRIKVLAALKKYYATEHMKKEKKKVSLALRELCK